MKLNPTPQRPAAFARQQGIALLLVLGAIVVLTSIVAGFTYTMKVEARLAQNFQNDSEMDWLARSGVELARFILAAELQSPDGRQLDALNQKWAGGVGSLTNDLLAGISLANNSLGRGRFALQITDQERRFNINQADPLVLERALRLMNVDAGDHGTLIDAITDWIDPDDDPGINGAESDDFYLRLDPPYYAKNGPIDDIAELLLVRGMSPELYWGSGSTNIVRDPLAPDPGESARLGHSAYITHGFRDLFSAVSARQVNINTCSAATLELAGIDPLVAQFVLEARRGPDGVDGTEDDEPFRSPAQIPFPGDDPQARQQFQQYFSVRSRVFEVIITCEIDGYVRQYRALLDRRSPREIVTLFLHGL